MSVPGSYARSVRLLFSSAFVDGYNLIVIAPILLILTENGVPLSGWLLGLLSVSAILGNLVGGLVLGHLGDLFGRRRVLLWDIGFFIAVPIACALAPSLLLLALFRFVLGIGIGGNYPLTSVLLSETSGRNVRGRQVALLGVAWTSGALTSYLLSAVLFPLGTLAIPILLLAVVAPASVVIILRSRISESDAWGEHMARLSLADRRKRSSVALLATPGVRRGTAYAAGFWFLFDVVQYGVSLFLPVLLVAFGHLRGSQALTLSALLYTGELAGTIAGLKLVDVLGRRVLQLAGFAAMAAGLLVAAVVPFSSATVLLFLLFVVTTGVGVGPGILEFVYPPELFPTALRATGSGFALTMSRVGASVGVLVVPLLLSPLLGSTHALFALYGAVALAAFVLTWTLAPETRGTPLPAG